jgi:hypothetical protein
MRRKRTIYFNDARHYYLFVFDPPMAMRDAWVPVDEVAGTAVDTFVYGVARGDGLFYPSKAGLRFGADSETFDHIANWRVWENMQSLLDRGLDPLGVLIDRAHEYEMDFFSSLRMGDTPGLDPKYKLNEGGRGYMHQEYRDHQFAVLKELAVDYPAEGVELDFAAPPGGSSYCFRREDAKEGTDILTEWVKTVVEMVRGRPGRPGEIGARVYPTLEMNEAAGLDVRTWLKEGFLDYVNPMRYGSFALDMDKPIEWLIDSAHAADASVYPMLHPPGRSGHANLDMMRAAAASYWDRGADGMYTWFLKWPLGPNERAILTEIGHPQLVAESNKHYIVLQRNELREGELPYDAPLPIEISADQLGQFHEVPFFIADDIEACEDRIKRIRLEISVSNIVGPDRVTVSLNGESIDKESCHRDFLPGGPYAGQRLVFELKAIRPKKGRNVLKIALVERPPRLASTVTVSNAEVMIEYGPYKTALNQE